MSVATRRGDSGSTGLLFNVRVAKNHPQIETNGRLDELLKSLGLARAFCADLSARLQTLQEDLSCLMGEIATPEGMRERYVQAGYRSMRAELLAELDLEIDQLEQLLPRQTGWEWPGEHPAEAFLAHAGSVCRTAERAVYALSLSHPTIVSELHLKTLNRLSDWLHLQGRRKRLGL